MFLSYHIFQDSLPGWQCGLSWSWWLKLFPCARDSNTEASSDHRDLKLLHLHILCIIPRAFCWNCEQVNQNSSNSSSRICKQPLGCLFYFGHSQESHVADPALTVKPYTDKPLLVAVAVYAWPDLSVARLICKVNGRLVSLHNFQWLSEWLMRSMS